MIQYKEKLMTGGYNGGGVGMGGEEVKGTKGHKISNII